MAANALNMFLTFAAESLLLLQCYLDPLWSESEVKPRMRRRHLDGYATVVFHSYGACTAGDRHAGRDRGVDAVDIGKVIHIVNYAGSRVTADADVDYGKAANTQIMFLALPSHRATSPLIANAGGYGSTRKLYNSAWYSVSY